MPFLIRDLIVNVVGKGRTGGREWCLITLWCDDSTSPGPTPPDGGPDGGCGNSYTCPNRSDDTLNCPENDINYLILVEMKEAMQTIANRLEGVTQQPAPPRTVEDLNLLETRLQAALKDVQAHRAKLTSHK